jgi:hypothetical protein
VTEEEQIMNADRRAKQAWHLSREVSITHLVATLSVVSGLIISWSKMDSRIDTIERKQIEAVASMSISDSKIDRQLESIKNEIAAINKQFLVEAQRNLDRERSYGFSNRNR